MDAVAGILGRAVSRIPESQSIEYSKWMESCLVLLLARLPCRLSHKALDVVAMCFSGMRSEGANVRSDETMKMMISKFRGDKFLISLHLQERIRYAVLDYSGWQFHHMFTTMLQLCCCACRKPTGESESCKSLTKMFAHHSTTMPIALRESTYEIMVSYLLHQIKKDLP